MPYKWVRNVSLRTPSFISLRKWVPGHWLVCNLNPDPCSSLHGLMRKALETAHTLKYHFPLLAPEVAKCLHYLPPGPRYWYTNGNGHGVNPLWHRHSKWVLLHSGGEPQGNGTLTEKRAVDIRGLSEDLPCTSSWEWRYRSGHSTYLTTLTCPLTRVALLPRNIC